MSGIFSVIKKRDDIEISLKILKTIFEYVQIMVGGGGVCDNIKMSKIILSKLA